MIHHNEPTGHNRDPWLQPRPGEGRPWNRYGHTRLTPEQHDASPVRAETVVLLLALILIAGAFGLAIYSCFL